MPDGADVRDGAPSGRHVIVATHIVWTLIVWTLVLLVLVGPGEAAPDNLLLRVPLVVLALGLSALVVALVIVMAAFIGRGWGEYAILLGSLAMAIIIALFFLRDHTRALPIDAASSVSNAPGG